MKRGQTTRYSWWTSHGKKQFKLKTMYKQHGTTKTNIKVNKSTEGETIEQKVERILNNKEPIKDGAPIIHQERGEGVNPVYDIRTDRMEIAAELMDKKAKADVAKREQRHKPKMEEGPEAQAAADKRTKDGQSGPGGESKA